MSEFVFCIIYLLLSNFFSYHFICTLQLNGYKISKIFDFNNKKYIKFLVYNLLLSLAFLFINLYICEFKNYYIFILNSIYLAIFIILLLKNKNNFTKTPLRFTNRIIRFYVLLQLVNIIIITLFIIYIKKFINILFPMFSLVNFINVIFTYFITLPFEKLNNYRYINLAKHKFNNNNIIKIAITGSYGKTSVKCILGHILSYKYNTYYAKNNYNTELGLSILSNQITEDTDIFIAEFGAKHKNDIKKLVKIFNPDVAVITGICNQHLESFKNIDNIVKTKSEILLNKPIAYFNGNNNYVKNMYNNYDGNKYITFDKNNYIDNVKLTCEGTYFTIHLDGKYRKCYTKLLGNSCLENILLSSVVAYNLGVNIDIIAKSIIDLPFIEHRLSVKTSRFTIIDDSYNSNETGVNEALFVLNLFDKTKYVFASGLIELGSDKKQVNINLGKNIANIANYVILINQQQTKYIIQGLNEKNFNKNNIYIYNSTNDAIKDFDNIILDNSVLLLMSDLPSNYNV